MTDNDIIQQYKKYEPIFGNWYIKRFVGEGGFAKVFEIVRNDFGKEYSSALKIITVSKTKSEINTLKSEGMTDDDIREYLRGIVEDTVGEIQLMYKMRGRGNIVGYEDHEVIEHEDDMGWDILIKMEYLTSLSTYIRQQEGRLAKRDIIKLGVDICKALESCQRYNIIHRDIKADNIFISDEGEFKLGDFGIARVIERKDQTLSKKGTSAYMAPEVYKGKTYTSAVDIYSLGMVMYRLMNNNRGPFLPPYPQPMSLDDRDQAMMLRMSGERFSKPSQVTRGRLVEIVLKACSYRPEERYSSPGFMRQELEAIYLDMDEMTTEEWVMIYDAEGRGTAATLSTGQNDVSVQQSPENPEPTGATEVLREEGATEVLREEGATEVLQEQSAPAHAQSMLSRATKTCIKCGGAIDYKFMFCPICGSSQKEEPEPLKVPEQLKTSEQPKEPEKPEAPEQKPVSAAQQEEPKSPEESEPQKESDKSSKLRFIGIVCAVLLSLVMIIGVALRSSDGRNSKPSNQYAAQQSPEPTQEPQETPEPIQEPKMPWSDNILMKVISAEGKSAKFLGSDVTRGMIVSITFLDTLDSMPSDAWDISADGNGSVMAWAVPNGDYYDLYIGGQGGVSANEDSRHLFRFMTNLETIHFNGCFHTEKDKQMGHMFSDCSNLSGLDLSSFDTSNVTDMQSMFSDCSNLISLDLSSFDTSNVTDMQSMFSGCTNLSSLDLSGFNTSNITDMQYMFSGCRNLSSLDLSGFDTSNVTKMQYMFYDCVNLISLDLSSFDTSNVTNMVSMFRFCRNLISLDLSNFDTSKVTKANLMFNYCDNLTSIYVGKSFSKKSDMNIPSRVTIYESTTQKTPSPSPSSTPKPSATEQPPASSEPEPERPDQNPPPDSPGSSESRPDRPDRPDRPEQ